jgi:hypothetical protein
MASITPIGAMIPSCAMGAISAMLKLSSPQAVVTLVITTASPEWPRAWATASPRGCPSARRWYTITRMCTESHTPTTTRKAGSMLRVMEKGIPSNTMIPMLETSAAPTTQSGRSSPVARRKRMNSSPQMTRKASAMNAVASRCMVSVRA